MAAKAGFQIFFVKDIFLGPDWNELKKLFPHIQPEVSKQDETILQASTDVVTHKLLIANQFLNSFADCATTKNMNDFLHYLGSLVAKTKKHKHQEEHKK